MAVLEYISYQSATEMKQKLRCFVYILEKCQTQIKSSFALKTSNHLCLPYFLLIPTGVSPILA